jgi:hypothetical protein
MRTRENFLPPGNDRSAVVAREAFPAGLTPDQAGRALGRAPFRTAGGEGAALRFGGAGLLPGGALARGRRLGARLLPTLALRAAGRASGLLRCAATISADHGAPPRPGSAFSEASRSPASSPISAGAQKADEPCLPPRRARCGRCGGHSFPARSACRSCRHGARSGCRSRARRRRWRPARQARRAELGQGAVTLVLAFVAVDRADLEAPGLQQLHQLFRPVLGAAEDQRLFARVLLEIFLQQRALSPFGM